MLKDRIEKKNLIINSLIDLQEDDGKGKGRKFVSRFIEPGLAHYKELGDIVITKETLDKFIMTMIGCPVIIDHKDVTDKNVDKLRVGTIADVWFNELDGWYYCSGILTDNEAIDLVKNQGWNVSCSYSFVSDDTQKTYHGKPIDMEFTDGEFLHLAIVEDPRYEGANIVVNSNESPIFKICDNDKQDLDDTSKDRWITIHPNGEKSKGKPIKIEAGKTVEEALKDKIQDWQNKNNQQTLFDIRKYDMQEEDYKKYKEEKKEAEKLHQKIKEIEDILKTPGALADEKTKNILQQDLKKLKEQGAIKPIPGEKYEDTVKRLKESIQTKQEKKDEFPTGGNTERTMWELSQEKNNSANNSTDKENVIMQVLDDLKNFILGVVNNEKEDEMKVENEDKRKLIDEIGGILKDKVDDEIIRTVIKKAEELSYEPSEDDKADNKCKNEEDKKEEDKEEAENKCKNEKEEEVEEEKEKEDVTKNEDKEEKEVKNSMKDLVMGGNGKVEEQKLYVSRKERLEEGNKF